MRSEPFWRVRIGDRVHAARAVIVDGTLINVGPLTLCRKLAWLHAEHVSDSVEITCPDCREVIMSERRL